MKKILLFIILAFIFPILNGCYLFGDSRANYGQLLGIQFFDLEYQEIEGEYIEYYNWKYNESKRSQFQSTQYRVVPINSPAPMELYYTTTVALNSSIIVRIEIEQKNGYQFQSLKLNMFDEMLREDFYHIEEVENIIYLDILYEAITEDNFEFEISSFLLTKEMSNGIVTKEGSRYIEGRSYYSGFLFQFPKNDNV